LWVDPRFVNCRVFVKIPSGNDGRGVRDAVPVW
jgi:hypothetical protein